MWSSQAGSSLRTLLVTAALGGVTGCYAAQFDPELDGVYACESDDDCSTTFACINRVCVDTRGPEVHVIGPEEFEKFSPPMNGESINIILNGTDLTLVEPGGANVDGEGHVEILLDGQEIGTLTVGSLAGSPSLDGIALPSGLGVHRITAIARRNDGTRYENPAASETIVFWIDDGQTPQVAIRRPVPEVVLSPDPETGQAAVDMDLVTLNFDVLNPSFLDMGEFDKPNQGHVHVIFNRGVPDCIPNTDCNDKYVSAVFPPGEDRVKRISPNPNPLPLPPSPPGTYQLAIVAEWSDHEPYPSDDVTEVVYDAVDIIIAE